MVSLKVDGLSHRTIVEDLEALFSKYGRVGDVYIPKDYRTRDSRGFGFVRFFSKRDAEDAIDSLDGRKYDGRELSVQYARYDRPQRDHRGMPYTGSKRSRSRSRSRDRRRRSRSRDRRSRSRDRRSRSKDRRSRSKDRRSRSKDRRSRSKDRRSRSKDNRSRSKEERRSRSRDRKEKRSRSRSGGKRRRHSSGRSE